MVQKTIIGPRKEIPAETTCGQFHLQLFDSVLSVGVRIGAAFLTCLGEGFPEFVSHTLDGIFPLSVANTTKEVPRVAGMVSVVIALRTIETSTLNQAGRSPLDESTCVCPPPSLSVQRD